MKRLIHKYLLIPISLALLSIMSSSVYAAVGDECSIYLGQASLNEFFKDNTTQANDPNDFVEVEILDTSIDPVIYSDWTIQICEFDDKGKKNDDDGCSLEINLSSFDDTTFPWLVLNDGSIGSYYNFSTGFDAILLDGSGLVIDYLSVDGFNDQEVADCTGDELAFDSQASTPGASDKFMFRDPDGTGDWNSTPSAAEVPTEGSTNNGAGGGGGPQLNHFSITPTTVNASTCLANAVTIIAELANNNPVPNYTNQVQITVSTGHGNWSISNADGVLAPDPDTDDNGAVSYTFVPTDLAEIVLNFSNTHAEDVIITVSDTAEGVASSSVLINFSRNAFIITEDPIQIAGRPQSMTVEMWTDDAAASPSCAIDTNYNSNAQSLQASIDRAGVLLGAASPTINGTSISAAPAGITLDFSATPGSATFDLNTTDVGQYALTLEDTTLVHSSSIITGTSSLLTVRPFGLAVTNIIAGITLNPMTVTAIGTKFTTAGSDFSATVAGVLWSAADDTEGGVGDGVLDLGSRYDDNAVAPSYAWDTDLFALTTGGFTPATGIVGTLNNGDLLEAEFAGGSATVNDLQYTEVGSFTLQALATAYLGVLGADIVGDDIIVGRFIPAYFDIAVTNGEFANTCVQDPLLMLTPFTYVGESFFYGAIYPSFIVSAMNALDDPTLNYKGAWGKLDASSVSVTGPVADNTQLGSDLLTLMAITYTTDIVGFAAPTDNANGTFTYVFPNDEFLYNRDANSEISEFDSDIDITVTTVIDQEGISTTAPFTLTPNPVHLRFGRIKMSNVHGSELIDLAMPMFVEYYDLSGTYVINSDDNDCTNVATGDLVITDNLSTPATSAVTVTISPTLLGDQGVTLTAPGAGIDGSIIVTPNLTVVADWLRYEWDTTVGVDPFDDNPSATATFGIYSGNDVNIYQIQTFQ